MANVNVKPRTLDAAGKLYDQGETTAQRATATKRYAVAVAIILGTDNAGLMGWRKVSKGYASPIRAVLKSEGIDNLDALHALGIDSFGTLVTAQVATANGSGTSAPGSSKGKGSASKGDAPGSSPRVKGDDIPAAVREWIESAADDATAENRYAAVIDAANRARRNRREAKKAA